ncbi:MAG: hypothetical protein AB1629_03050 [Candidatus Omnitrophota bacterium]
MVELDVFLLLGDDLAAKNIKIRQFRQKFLGQIKEVVDFNIDEVDGENLTLKELQETLKRLPLNSKKRLLIIRNTDCLDESASQFLSEFIFNISKFPFKILLSTKEDKKNSANRLINNLNQAKNVRVIYCRQKREARVFDLARLVMEEGNAVASLQVLNRLLDEGKPAQQILGGLFWYWNNASPIKNQSGLKKDLGLFIEADAKIKTGKVAPELALELLVVKLCR